MAFGGVKRDKYDATFSSLIREANEWKCEACGRSFETNRKAIHCSHFFGRRYQGIRFRPENAFAHCASCHLYFTENPYDFTTWAGERVDIDSLRAIRGRVWKWLEGEKDYMDAFYRYQLRIIRRLREDGVVGWIEPVPYTREMYHRALDLGYVPKRKKKRKKRGKK